MISLKHAQNHNKSHLKFEMFITCKRNIKICVPHLLCSISWTFWYCRDVIDSGQINKSTFSLCELNQMVGYRIEIINILYPNNAVSLLIKSTLFPDTFLLTNAKWKYWNIFYGFCKRNWKEWCTLLRHMAKTQLIEPNRIDISDINDIPINNSAPTNTLRRI